MRKITCVAAVAAGIAMQATTAAATENSDLQALKEEIKNIKNKYESRISELEGKINKLEAAPAKQQVAETKAAPAASDKAKADSSFNPAISVILNGKYGNFSSDAADFAGFAIGEEGERASDGFSVGESEVNVSANVDDKFFGSMTAALVNEGGGTEIELEEAYFQTLAGMGLPDGLSLKAGRALWTLGYLNEHHAHSDDFADRPLPYRAFLNNHYNDDGVELSYVLPTELYTEIGGGAFRGDDFPYGGADGKTFGAWSGFARVGGDIGDDQSWRLGAYILSGEADNRLANEDNIVFKGDTNLYAADARYVWAPTGNNKDQEVILQAEYFMRDEKGTYEDIAAATGDVGYDGSQSGWYLQGVYKFLPQWRVGARYSQLYADDIPVALAGTALDANGHDPYSVSFMGDWTNSEFSRVRLQYNYEELAKGQDDNQFLLQYVMSIGAHPAHKY